MQTVGASLLAVLRTGVNGDASSPVYDFADLIEFYDSSYTPDPVNGFEPADAVETFAAIEITWNGIAYRREMVSRGSIDRNVGQQTNSVSLNFSNIDSYLATWAQTTEIEGMWAVVRCVSQSISSDSIVLFIGRAGKPSTINNKSFSIAASQDIIDLNAELPIRSFNPSDPEGRAPEDPLYEGIRFIAVAGSFQYPVVIPAQNTFARLIGQRDTIYVTKQWSSLDSTPYGNPIREVLGRAQVELIPFIWADKGVQIAALWAACAGPIQAIENLKTRTPGWGDLINSFETPPDPPEIHLGDLGGTGTNAVHPIGWPNAGFFSHLAYVSASTVGSTIENDDSPPVVTGLVVGRKVPAPNGSGVYSSIDVEADLEWSDNPVHLTRWVFIVSGLGEDFLEDAVNYQTGLWCDEPLLDESNSERVFIPSTDIPQTGGVITRFVSTGIIDAHSHRWLMGDPVDDPWLREPGYEPLPLDDIPGTYTIQRVYRKRYTFNSPISERVKVTDFLYKVLYPAFRGYHVINSKGKVEIKSEKASDNCLLRAATIVGATTLLVDDVIPWKENLLLQGKLLIGGTIGLTTSEVRRVSSATYTADANAITLTAAKIGAVTVSASGATLSGGSTTVKASGTVTIGGTPGAGDTVTVTINGIAVVYTVISDETTTSVAAMLAYAINANTQLKRFIKATSSGAVLTVTAKWGVLNLDSALANTHTGPRADPTSAPTLAQTAGTMAAGTYKVAYAYVTAIGRTTISPVASIVLTANKKIDVTSLGALPGGVLSVNWYVSESPDTDKLVYYANNSGGAFSITALPSKDNPGAPSHNTTGEECIRIALSFATNTQGATVLAQAGLTRGNAKDYNYPLGSEQASVNQVKGKFRDAKNDFALTPFLVNDPVHYAQVGKWKPLEVDYSGVDNWHQAFRLANAALSKNREGDWFNSLMTGTGEALLLDEADLITVCDASGGLINVASRIESMSISPNWEVTIRKARKYSTLMFSDDVRQHVIPLPSSLRYVQPRISILELVNGPPIWDRDGVTPGWYAVVSYDDDLSGDWKGASLYADYGDGYKLIDAFDALGTTGTCTTILPTATSPGWDRTSTLTVQLDRGELTDKTEDDLKADARTNLAAVGNSIDGWEYVQFAGVTDNGDGEYEIEGPFYRGAFGTDDSRMTHHASDRFILFNGAEKFIPMDPIRLNGEFDYKAVTTNQDVADATGDALKEDAVWDGGTAKTLPPTNLTAYRDSGNDILYRFNRQARYGQGMSPLSDVPLVEEREKFLLEVYDGATLKRTMEVIPGTQLAAVLISESGFTGVNHNTFEPTTNSTARSVQEVTQAGNFIEGNLKTELTTITWSAMGLQVSGGRWKGFCADLMTDYGSGGFGSTLDANATIPYLVILEAKLTGIDYWQRFHVYEYGTRIFSASSLSGESDYDGEFGWSAFLSNIGFMRVKFNFVGSSIRIQKAHTQNVPFVTVATSERAATFPYFAVCAVPGLAGTYKVQDVRMTIYPQPATIYSATQQIEDGFTPGNTIKVRVKEVSSIVGPGFYREATI